MKVFIIYLNIASPQVRKAAQACLPYVMAHVGWAGMVEKLGALDTKSKKTVQVGCTMETTGSSGKPEVPVSDFRKYYELCRSIFLYSL